MYTFAVEIDKIFSIEGVCTAIGSRIPESISAMLWNVITTLWPWYWLVIVLALGVWIFYEIKTRNGTAHYNSKNGFSPPFNSFVGSGTYLGLQGLVYLLMTFILGDVAYCVPWTYALHVAAFLGTGHLLNAIGFWPEVRVGSPRRRWYPRKRR